MRSKAPSIPLTLLYASHLITFGMNSTEHYASFLVKMCKLRPYQFCVRVSFSCVLQCDMGRLRDVNKSISAVPGPRFWTQQPNLIKKYPQESDKKWLSQEKYKSKVVPTYSMVPLPKQGCFIHQTKCPNHGNWWFEGFWILSTWARATACESCYSNFGTPCSSIRLFTNL